MCGSCNSKPHRVGESPLGSRLIKHPLHKLWGCVGLCWNYRVGCLLCVEEREVFSEKCGQQQVTANHKYKEHISNVQL